MTRRITSISLLLGVLFLAPVFVQAQEPSIVGSWNITFYLEPNHTPGPTVCVDFKLVGGILGEPMSGVWQVIPFPGWSGEWFQEGEHVQWYGFLNDLATSHYGDLANDKMAQGKFNDFVLPGTSVVGGAWTAVRIGQCSTVAVQPAVSPQAFFSNDPAVPPDSGGLSNRK